jgi:hypothetical protein
VYFVLDEAIGGVHLAGSVSVRALERIFALDGCTASNIANIPMYSRWYLRGSQTCEEAELSWTNLAAVISGHVDGRVLGLCDIVMRYWVAVRFYGDLDIAVDVLSSDYRCTKAGINA